MRIFANPQTDDYFAGIAMLIIKREMLDFSLKNAGECCYFFFFPWRHVPDSATLNWADIH